MARSVLASAWWAELGHGPRVSALDHRHDVMILAEMSAHCLRSVTISELLGRPVEARRAARQTRSQQIAELQAHGWGYKRIARVRREPVHDLERHTATPPSLTRTEGEETGPGPRLLRPGQTR
jgi:hypothetical protein